MTATTTATMTGLEISNLAAGLARLQSVVRDRDGRPCYFGAEQPSEPLIPFRPEWAHPAQFRGLAFRLEVPTVLALLQDEEPAIVEIVGPGEDGTVTIYDAKIRDRYDVDPRLLSVERVTAGWCERQRIINEEVAAGRKVFSGGGCRAANFFSPSRSAR